jgi:hypothetical protein
MGLVLERPIALCAAVRNTVLSSPVHYTSAAGRHNWIHSLHSHSSQWGSRSRIRAAIVPQRKQREKDAEENTASHKFGLLGNPSRPVSPSSVCTK